MGEFNINIPLIKWELFNLSCMLLVNREILITILQETQIVVFMIKEKGKEKYRINIPNDIKIINLIQYQNLVAGVSNSVILLFNWKTEKILSIIDIPCQPTCLLWNWKSLIIGDHDGHVMMIDSLSLIHKEEKNQTQNESEENKKVIAIVIPIGG